MAIDIVETHGDVAEPVLGASNSARPNSAEGGLALFDSTTVQLVDNAMGEIELGVRVQEPTTADGYVELNMLLDAMTLDQRERV